METVRRVLKILAYLTLYTDENHVARASDILAYLKKYGIETTARKIRSDIEWLIGQGYNIEIIGKNGVAPVFYDVHSDWELPELQVLIDAVHTASFLDEKFSAELIAKIAGMTGPSYKDELIPPSGTICPVKTDNDQIKYTLMQIREAERQGKKISFLYYDYNVHKQKIPRHNSQSYTFSPYGTLWMDDRYYVVGWSDQHNKIITLRTDRLSVPNLMTEDAVPKPESFDLKKYYTNMFKMYDGPEVLVTLECQSQAVGHLIDRFGLDVKINLLNDHSFRVCVPICVSPTFYGWLLQYTGQITVISPEPVVRGYWDYLNKAKDLVSAQWKEKCPGKACPL